MPASYKLEMAGLERLQKELVPKADQIVGKIAYAIEAQAKRSMQGTKSGRVYKRGEREHQASAPGEPPAIDMGALVNSIYVGKPGPGTRDVGATMEYASYLEFGTSRMAARPWLIPAVESQRDAWNTAWRELLK